MSHRLGTNSSYLCRLETVVCPRFSHVASAIQAGAAWFLTTDHALLRKLKGEKRLSGVDPVDFIRSLQEVDDEN